MKIYKFSSKKIEKQLNPVPKDFTLYTIEELGDFYKGKGISRSEIRTDGLACVTYGSIYTTHNEVIGSIETFISDDTADNSFLLQSGDILFTGSGETQEEIGKASAYIDAELCYAGGDIIVLRPNPVFDSRYLAYLFNSYIYHIQRMRLGQGYSVVHIQGDHIKSIIVPIPSFLEQKKIAEILTTWDDAINVLNKQLDYQKTYRKGIMKSMVLKHYTEQKKLSNNLRLKKYLKLQNETVLDRDIEPVSVGVNGIRLRSEIYSKELSADYSKNKVMRENNLCFGIGTNNIVYDVLFENKTYCVSPAYKVFTINGINPFYLKCYLDTFNEYYSKKYMIISARQGKSVDMDGLLNERIYVPSFEDQILFSNAMKSIDELIILLNKQIEFINLQKKGLMQQLLTGKIRVNVS